MPLGMTGAGQGSILGEPGVKLTIKLSAAVGGLLHGAQMQRPATGKPNGETRQPRVFELGMG
jgi:hypothetical protein